MSTRWYLTDGTNSDVHRLTGPTASQLGETDAAPSEPADKNTCKAATASVGGGETSRSFDVSAGSDAAFAGMFATPPLGAQALADGATLTLAVPVAKGGVVNGLLLSAGFYVWRAGIGMAAALGGGLVVDDVTAATTQRWRQVIATVSGAVALHNGDQIVCEVWGSYSVVSGTRTMMFFFNGTTDDYATAGENTDVTDSAAWIECNQSLAAASHTFFYAGLDRVRGLKP